ncbi:uncharacterized protein LOC117116312 isoform X2 [Anneissia japonica]|nr:uncharacterized protein LOC117116312 isoform X2 [Anneissia japonica]
MSITSMFIQGSMEMKRLPTPGKFLTADQAFEEFSSSPSIYDSIPFGEKNNLYLFIDNYENFKKRLMNKHASYPDDFIWDGCQGSTVFSTFIRSSQGSLKSVNLKDGLYCIESRPRKKKRLWKPLDPQPSPNDIIKMNRYYTKLKSNYNYKKRVTTFFYKNKFNNLALVEYCGTYNEAQSFKSSEDVKMHSKNLSNLPGKSDDNDGSIGQVQRETVKEVACEQTIDKEATEIYMPKSLPTPGKFLTADQAFEEFSTNPFIYDFIPFGEKNNVYLFIDNYENFKRRSMNKRASYPDGLVWDGSQGSTVFTTFIMSSQGSLKSVNLKNGLYCTESRPMKKKRVWKPLDPQPLPDEIIKMNRYYTKLKSNYNYKKRVTTFFYKDKFNNLALVEYCGNYNEDESSKSSEGVKKYTKNRSSVSVDSDTEDSNIEQIQRETIKEVACEQTIDEDATEICIPETSLLQFQEYTEDMS